MEAPNAGLSRTWNGTGRFRRFDRSSRCGLRRDADAFVGLVVARPRSANSRGAEEADRPRLADHDGDVLLLDRRDHVADPRRLHGLRGRRRAAQEPHVDGDEEHPDHRRRHADLLLLRLVHLRLLRGRLAEERPCQPGCGARLLRAHRALELGDGPEHGEQPHRAPEPRLLPRLPPVLLDHRVDHVRRDHRARAAVGVPDSRGRARLGRLDPGRGLGLERRRLADDPLRLPRLRSRHWSSTAWRARSRSACCSTSGHGSGSTTSWAEPDRSDPTTRT